MGHPAVKAAVLAMMLAVMLDMSAAEFAALQQLPAKERREQLGMRDSCSPRLTAVKEAPAASGHLTVLVTCKAVKESEPTQTRLMPTR
jgi:hypothetical protein